MDTSVWIDHLNVPNPTLATYLMGEMVLVHPFVIGEIALGSVKNRQALIDDFHRLPAAKVAQDQEVVRLIVERELGGTGIGYVDAHLLASVIITWGSKLWTHDRRLAQCAQKLGILSEFSKRLN